MMNKKLILIIASIAAAAAILTILFLTGFLPGRSDPSDVEPSGSPEEPLSDIKQDSLPDELLVPPESPVDQVSGATPGDAPYLIDPTPAKMLGSDELSAWNLILVNSEHAVPRDFTVDLTKVSGGYLVDVRISEALEAMIRDAASEGIVLTVCSAFRTVKSQKSLVEKKAQSLMASGFDPDIAYSMAGNYIASPGYSEHHTGLAVDFLTTKITRLDESFAKTEAYKWLTANAHRYGFILRYPKGKEEITKLSFEPWHYRYVGREHATAIKAANLSLEEYIASAQ